LPATRWLVAYGLASLGDQRRVADASPANVDRSYLAADTYRTVKKSEASGQELEFSITHETLRLDDDQILLPRRSEKSRRFGGGGHRVLLSNYRLTTASCVGFT
jgi:hypothetical protein